MLVLVELLGFSGWYMPILFWKYRQIPREPPIVTGISHTARMWIMLTVIGKFGERILKRKGELLCSFVLQPTDAEPWTA